MKTALVGAVVVLACAATTLVILMYSALPGGTP